MTIPGVSQKKVMFSQKTVVSFSQKKVVRFSQKKGREIFPKNQEMSENFGSICVRGGNGVPSPPRGAVMGSQVCPALRGGAVMGSQVCGAGRGRVLKLYVRGGNGVPVVTPCHSLVRGKSVNTGFLLLLLPATAIVEPYLH